MESIASASSERSQRGRLTPVATGALGKAAELGTQAALVTAVPRVIGPSAYGTFALALAVTGIGSSLVTVGGGAVLGRYVPAT
jgi:O-antigen/teichoic acid export membrane protein